MPRGQRAARGPSRLSGIALVLVLWVLTLLTVMAVGMTAAQRTETALTDNRIAQARFRALSDAAIAYAMYSLALPPESADGVGLGGGLHLGAADAAGQTQTAWVPDGVPRPWQFDGEALEIAIYNERSRLNLNQATADQLAALMVTLGADEEQAGRLADAILDFRDEDDLKLLNGAEDKDYEDAGRAIGAKDAPFAAVEELQQVLGMTPELYRLMAPELTADTDDNQVDLEFASAAVLAALQGITLEEAQIKVQERNAPALPGGQAPVPSSRGGPLYRLRIGLGGAGGRARAMEALVELTQGQEPPYQVRWRRYGIPPSPTPGAAADESAGKARRSRR